MRSNFRNKIVPALAGLRIKNMQGIRRETEFDLLAWHNWISSRQPNLESGIGDHAIGQYVCSQVFDRSDRSLKRTAGLPAHRFRADTQLMIGRIREL